MEIIVHAFCLWGYGTKAQTAERDISEKAGPELAACVIHLRLSDNSAPCGKLPREREHGMTITC